MNERVHLTTDDVANDVEQRVRELHATVSKLGSQVIDQQATVGDWSLRDLFAHLIYWHEQCIDAIRTTMNGTYQRRDLSNIDEINAAAVTGLKEMSGEEAVEKLLTTGLDVAEMIRQVPQDLWTAKERLAAWVNVTVFKHYDEHMPDIERLAGSA